MILGWELEHLSIASCMPSNGLKYNNNEEKVLVWQKHQNVLLRVTWDAIRWCVCLADLSV